MNKAYIISFICFKKNEGSFSNYQIIWEKSKKEAVRVALENETLKDTRCIITSVKRIRQSLIDLIQEHNAIVDGKKEIKINE